MTNLFWGFFIIAALFIGGIIFLIVWVINQSTKPISGVEAHNEKGQLRQRVLQKRAKLSSWKSHSTSSLSLSVKYSYQQGISNRVTGTLYTNDGEAVIAFSSVRRGMASTGLIAAASTDFTLVIGIRENGYVIEYDGEGLGAITTSGELINLRKEVIGTAVHPHKMSVSIGSLEHRTGDKTFPIHINGRQLAVMHVAPNYLDGNFGSAQLMKLTATPEGDEEKWLQALAVLEVAFHGFWF